MASCRRQRAAGGFEVGAFRVDWARGRVTCPAGRESVWWRGYAGGGLGPRSDPAGRRGPLRDPFIKVRFAKETCQACALRGRGVRGASGGRQLLPHPEPAHASAWTRRSRRRARFASPAGRRAYALRSGVEAAMSQAVRAFGPRRARYRGLAEARLQGAATAAAPNAVRLDAWLAGRPLAPARVSRFARLAA